VAGLEKASAAIGSVLVQGMAMAICGRWPAEIFGHRFAGHLLLDSARARRGVVVLQWQIKIRDEMCWWEVREVGTACLPR